MKYSFCYTLKKMVKKDEEKKPDSNQFFFEVKDGTFLLLQCGPWRSSKEEVQRDEDLYNNDPDAFFEMVRNKNGS